MYMEISEKQKTVYYWLSKEEKEDSELRCCLRSQYYEWEQKGYSVCVFLSGNSNLVETTKDLLVHNKKVLATKNLECSQTAVS
ncbi:MAG: hypothetical protein LUI14_13540 [Lachnospiraceae bacterium]|nr:hypothetical protein [Lachnospiraceae bacterium]